MKLKRKNPCQECPFKKGSLPGWLGPWTVDRLIQQVHGEAGFGCHMDIKNHEHRETEDFYKHTHVCVGSLQHANISCKSYRNPELRKMQDLVGDGKNILGLREFRAHHSQDLKLLKKKTKAKGA